MSSKEDLGLTETRNTSLSEMESSELGPFSAQKSFIVYRKLSKYMFLAFQACENTAQAYFFRLYSRSLSLIIL